MRAVIAIRVSPRPQENVRYSPELQEQACRDWAAQHGHEVVGVVKDILVSGGAADRFVSIFAVLDNQQVDMFVVSDLSRWTRDRPSRFWAIKALLEDRGVKLVSVAEPWLDSETPFSDTVTTATVEMNYQERMRLKAKTSAGVRKAWAAGKRWGRPFGWTFDKHTRQWTHDDRKIETFYQDWIQGVSGYEMAARYGIFETNIRKHIKAECQREIVGDEVWERAQVCRPYRGQRRDAKRSSIYRGLLVCPFCGSTMQQTSNWGHYKCHKYQLTPHGWWSFSARMYVTPTVKGLLSRLRSPDIPPRETGQEGLLRDSTRDLVKEQDRLTMAWVKGRLSDERYEKALAELESLKGQHTLRVEAPEQIVLIRELSIIDLEDRDPESGNLANRILCQLLLSIAVHEDRSVTVNPSDWLKDWMDTDT